MKTIFFIIVFVATVIAMASAFGATNYFFQVQKSGDKLMFQAQTTNTVVELSDEEMNYYNWVTNYSTWVAGFQTATGAVPNALQAARTNAWIQNSQFDTNGYWKAREKAIVDLVINLVGQAYTNRVTPLTTNEVQTLLRNWLPQPQ